MRERGKSAERDVTAAREARLSAVRLVRWARRLGMTLAEVARELGMHERTLRAWARRWKSDRLEARKLGRSSSELSRDQRQSALWALHLTSGRIGLDELANVVWPRPTRRVLSDLKARWRRAVHRRGGKLCGLVQWSRAGTAWAMDWTDPDEPIDGGYAKVLSVRDLCSGKALLALPSVNERGEQVVRALRKLFAMHGAPLVLKEDNGGSLRCESVELLLAHEGILALTSPPACPRYNGACEAGIGSLKVVAGEMAAAAGREEAWTCDDIEKARRRVNSRPRVGRASADAEWEARAPIEEAEREALWRRYREEERRERDARCIAPDARLSGMEQASVDRRAIARALEGEGLVCFRRRWIRPPIRGRKVASRR